MHFAEYAIKLPYLDIFLLPVSCASTKLLYPFHRHKKTQNFFPAKSCRKKRKTIKRGATTATAGTNKIKSRRR